MDIPHSPSVPTPSRAWSRQVEPPDGLPSVESPIASGEPPKPHARKQESMRLRARLLDLIVAREAARRSSGEGA